MNVNILPPLPTHAVKPYQYCYYANTISHWDFKSLGIGIKSLMESERESFFAFLFLL